MKTFFLLCGIALLAGCTTAGPFVTSISSDGNNGLNIVKCDVHMNAFMGTISNSNCHTTSVRIRN